MMRLIFVNLCIKGFEKIDAILTPRTLLLRMLRDVVNIPVPNMVRVFSPKDHAKMLQFHGKLVLFVHDFSTALNNSKLCLSMFIYSFRIKRIRVQN